MYEMAGQYFRSYALTYSIIAGVEEWLIDLPPDPDCPYTTSINKHPSEREREREVLYHYLFIFFHFINHLHLRLTFYFYYVLVLHKPGVPCEQQGR